MKFSRILSCVGLGVVAVGFMTMRDASAAPTQAARAAVSVPVVVAEAPAKTAATCRVLSILAKKDGDGSVPANLKALESQLRSDQFAAYKSFSLLEEQTLPVTARSESSVAMKVGYDVKLRLIAVTGARLKLHLSLTSKGGAKPLLDADYSVRDKGVLLVVAGKRDDGRALFAFQCRAS